ncbi:DNA polymerase III subunit gamma and tau [Nigerium massiliense]|uniref:DNA polymerase III subunit gamma and tau n=1 Tax=Nigerium massiliense TaxID=1522317 RepID=UPI0006948562|nr:DNA polymerase III subunit gamma and tau [Nigerium massiliense]
MDAQQTDDLFDDEDDLTSPEAFEQEGPDLFGTEPDDLLLPPEPVVTDDPETDIEQDSPDEIPIDPDDSDETPAVTGPDDPEPEEPDAHDVEAAVEDEERRDTDPDELAELASEELAAGVIRADESAGKKRSEPEQGAPHQPEQHGPQGSAARTESEAPLALYRRYRPDTFAEVIGQEHVTEPLQRALANNRVNHAYLFSGPRGCGKTTSARILARCLNCEQGPTPTPCGQCQSCRDLARGGSGSIDVIEIDAASHGGVDEARDLRERAFFAPVHSRYKVYIIDEAHMVTTQGFNALLKVVEEPPPHVKFIFATTEPEKVIGTIRSRTHHYPFRLVPPKTLASYLTELCSREGVDVDPSVMPLVVRAGAGSVRDSLSVLDQLLGGSSAEGVTYQQATALLGYTPDSLLDEIVDAFAADDAEGVFASIDKVIEAGQDPRRFAEDLLRRLRDLIIVAAVPDALTSGLVDVAADQAERLTTQAAGMGAGELTRAAEVIAHGLTEMRGTTAPRLHLELMCARVLLPGADVDDRGIHARLDRLERRLEIPGQQAPFAPAGAGQSAGGRPGADSSAPAGRGTQAGTPAAGHSSGGTQGDANAGRSAGQTTADQQGPRAPERPVGSSQDDRQSGQPQEARQSGRPEEGRQSGQSQSVDHGQQGRAPQPGGQSQPSPQSQPPGRVGMGTADVRRLWPQVLEAVKNRRRVTWIVLSQNAQVHSFEDGTLTLSVDNPGARDSLSRGGHEDVLREAVIEVLGVAPKLHVVEEQGAPTPPPPGGGGQLRTGAGDSGGWRAGKPGPSGAGGQGDGRPPAGSDAPTRGQAAAPSGQGGQAPSAQAQRPQAADPRARRDYPATPPSPPPEEDDLPSVDYAAQARQNIRGTHRGPLETQEAAEPDRDDVDLDAPNVDVDDLLKSQLGAELIAQDDQTP